MSVYKLKIIEKRESYIVLFENYLNKNKRKKK